MLFCKQVARALDEDRYWKLPWHRRLGLRLHVLLCSVCGRYHRQVMTMQRAADAYLAHEQTDPPPPDLRLPDAARDRIRKSLSAPPP